VREDAISSDKVRLNKEKLPDPFAEAIRFAGTIVKQATLSSADVPWTQGRRAGAMEWEKRSTARLSTTDNPAVLASTRREYGFPYRHKNIRSLKAVCFFRKSNFRAA
jgi:hypothetical protein